MANPKKKFDIYIAAWELDFELFRNDGHLYSFSEILQTDQVPN